MTRSERAARRVELFLPNAPTHPFEMTVRDADMLRDGLDDLAKVFHAVGPDDDEDARLGAESGLRHVNDLRERLNRFMGYE